MSHCDIGLPQGHATARAVGTGVIVMGLAAASAHGSIVAAWNLNGIDPAAGMSYAATTGTGTLDFASIGAGASVLQGTTLGGQTGELAGDALAAIGTVSNGTALRLDFETTGYTDLVVSFATRRSSTGASANRLEYWNGLGWTSVLDFASNTTAWELVTLKLNPADFMGTDFAALRIVVDGATGSTGSIRFDNLTIAGNAVPAPGALALIALASCVARRRR